LRKEERWPMAAQATNAIILWSENCTAQRICASKDATRETGCTAQRNGHPAPHRPRSSAIMCTAPRGCPGTDAQQEVREEARHAADARSRRELAPSAT
jgi:hypothetical protein